MWAIYRHEGLKIILHFYRCRLANAQIPSFLPSLQYGFLQYQIVIQGWRASYVRRVLSHDLTIDLKLDFHYTYITKSETCFYKSMSNRIIVNSSYTCLINIWYYYEHAQAADITGNLREYVWAKSCSGQRVVKGSNNNIIIYCSVQYWPQPVQYS